MADKWEYNIVNLPAGINIVMDLLKKQGEQGWELVTVMRQAELKSDAPTDFWAYFKRQKHSVA